MRKLILTVIIIIVIIFAAVFAVKSFIISSADRTAEVQVDFTENVGQIRALNGINNGPVSYLVKDTNGVAFWNFDVTEIFKELEIPYVRTHDTEYPYGSNQLIDIHCIFPDFSADVEDPDSYNFAETDMYVESILASGAEPFFRLGESIDHSGKHLYIDPPSDYEKWAKICEHIVRHYNDSWDDGFAYNIQYWEIWNEPEQGSMWTGSYEELFELYAVTASYLKSSHPDIQIGGCAFTRATEEMLGDFLGYIKDYKEEVPLDFLSWHCYYNEPGKIAGYALTARRMLDEYGYADTLSVLDEWNYIEDWSDQDSSVEFRNSLAGGAFIAEALMEMQYNGVDLAMYYDGQYKSADFYCGLYSVYRDRKPGYYSYDYFNRLKRLGSQADAEFDTEGPVYALAASADGKNGIMLVNYSKDTVRLKLSCKGVSPLSIVHKDEVYAGYLNGKSSSDLAVNGSYTFKMQPWEIMYISL